MSREPGLGDHTFRVTSRLGRGSVTGPGLHEDLRTSILREWELAGFSCFLSSAIAEDDKEGLGRLKAERYRFGPSLTWASSQAKNFFKSPILGLLNTFFIGIL